MALRACPRSPRTRLLRGPRLDRLAGDEASSQLFWRAGKVAGLVLNTGIWVYVAPWHLPDNAWYTWAIAILGTDFLYYWYVFAGRSEFAHRG